MGIFEKLKEAGAGITKPVPPDEGVAPAAADEVRERIAALASDAISVEEGTEGGLSIAWHAESWNKSRFGGGSEEHVRGIELSFDEGKAEVHGIAFTHDVDDGYGPFHTGAHHEVSAERGQFTGAEFNKTLSNLGGEHGSSGGADEKGGYSFNWKDLRHPVIEAVTESGWTYVPKKL